MPKEMRDFLLTMVDYIIPVEAGYILVTGKNFEGEQANRLLAGASLVIEVGLTFTIVGKGFYKVGKGALKAGTKTLKAVDKSREILKKGKNIGKKSDKISSSFLEEAIKKYPKELEQTRKLTTKELEKGIKSLEKQIQNIGNTLTTLLRENNMFQNGMNFLKYTKII